MESETLPRVFIALFLITGGSAPQAADADALLGYSDGRDDQAMSIRVAGDRVRMDSDGGRTSTIFDLSERSMTVLDHDAGRYHVMDEATAERLQAKMEEARRQMEAQMAQVPAGQRAMMEQMMAQAMGAAAAEVPSEIRAEDTGETATVAGYECRILRSTADGEPMGESCVAEPSAVGMSDSDHATVQAAFRFAADFARAIASSAPVPIELDIQMAEMEGVPVRMEEGDGRTLTLNRVDDAEIPASELRPPSGYEKQDLGL